MAGINNKAFGDEPLQVVLDQGQELGKLQVWSLKCCLDFLQCLGAEEEMLSSHGRGR